MSKGRWWQGWPVPLFGLALAFILALAFAATVMGAPLADLKLLARFLLASGMVSLV
ncbi:MAG: DUF998 domain-containing protein, partial [Anaerolineae bacterium]|nr:DUF998 domain-containing protein [Anaerolineae bacterium]